MAPCRVVRGTLSFIVFCRSLGMRDGNPVCGACCPLSIWCRERTLQICCPLFHGVVGFGGPLDAISCGAVPFGQRSLTSALGSQESACGWCTGGARRLANWRAAVPIAGHFVSRCLLNLDPFLPMGASSFPSG